MISPAKLDKLPSEVVNLVQELQEEIIRDVCRRVTKANYLTPTAEWELYKANQLRLSYNEVNRRIARQLNVRERTVRELYTDTVKQALKEDADIYRTAAAMGRLPDSTGSKIDSYFRSAAFSMLLSKGLKKSRGQLRNLCDSMAAEANRELSDAMDLAHLKVISGAFSYDEAVYTAVKDLSEKGITRVEYPSGRRDFTDVCVRRAVLSSVNKSCCDIQLDLAREVGSRYVEVSAHFGARPSHAEWQGRIYSLVKGDRKYPYFYEATGYGTGEGLGGWNCRHNFFPFFEGIDTPYHTPEFTQTENNEYYALTQTQRRYERAVRDSKRKLAALDGARQSVDDPALRAKLDSDFARGSVTLKNREERLNSFIRENGLQRDNARVRVAGFGRSVSQKAVHSANNYQKAKLFDKFSLTGNKTNGIIKKNTNSIKLPTSLDECKNFKQLTAYLESQGVNVASDISQLHFKSVKESLKGIENVLNEFPNTNGALTKISVFNDDSMMKTSYSGEVGFSKVYYGKKGKYARNFKHYSSQNISRGQFPETNNSIASDGHHEAGHLLERLLISRNNAYANKNKAWNSCVEAESIVRRAYGNYLVKTPKNKMKLVDLRKGISDYSSETYSETLAEAVDDYMSNKANANPFSIEIVNVLKGEL